jgi:hypothetical protein
LKIIKLRYEEEMKYDIDIRNHQEEKEENHVVTDRCSVDETKDLENV